MLGTVEDIFRREAGRVRATLIRLLGDFDLAEEAQQDAFAAAVEQWPTHGVPRNPCAWLINTGRNKAVDRIRRDVLFRTKIFDREMASAEAEATPGLDDKEETVFEDDRLRLIFTCCHPALSSTPWRRAARSRSIICCTRREAAFCSSSGMSAKLAKPT
jgi:RNA polymerase sigma-70 factor (ECF subfamily)